MDWWGDGLTVLLWLVGLFVAFRALQFFLSVDALLKVRFGREHVERVEAAEVPASHHAVLSEPIAELEALGMHVCAWVSLQTPDAKPQLSALMVHPPSSTFGMLIPDLSAPTVPYTLVFVTPLQDDGSLATYNGRTLDLGAGAPRPVTIIDVYVPTVAEHWASHLSNLEQLGADQAPVPTSIDDFLAVDARHANEDFDARVRNGTYVVERGTGSASLSLRMALRWAWQAASGGMSQGLGLAAKIRQQRAPMTLPPAIEADMFERWETSRNRPSGRRTWLWIAAGTAALTALSFLRWLEPIDAVVLVGVLGFHELGHYVAMRSLGYSGTKIFFIPFLGAATVGRRDAGPAWAEFVVLLAGPLPGIVAGLLLLFLWPAAPWNLATWLIVLNLLNLLPLLPLDGGRIVQLCALRGRPWASAAFRIVAMVVFGAGAWVTRDWILAFLAVSFVLTFRAQWRSDRFNARLRASLSGEQVASRRQVIERAFELLGGQAGSTAGNLGTVAAAVGQRRRRTPLLHRLTGLAIYGGVLVATLGSIVGAAFVHSELSPGELWRVAEEIGSGAYAAREPTPLVCGAIDTPTPSSTAGARFPLARLVCRFEDPAQAAGVSAAVQAVGVGLEGGLCLRWPWEGSPLSEAEVRARRTVADLMRAPRRDRIAAFRAGEDPAPLTDALRAQSYRRALERLRSTGEPWVDRQALALASAVLVGQPADAVDARTEEQAAAGRRELEHRLGPGTACGGEAPLVYAGGGWTPEQTAVRVSMGMPVSLYGTVADYLCEQGCPDLRGAVPP